jgi:NAD(P)-dependent dehydrogenase (short-subunit alcohol dehydrogenase family)
LLNLNEREKTDMHLTGRIALVTGSSKGIGRAAAIRLGRAGARVCINARTDVKGGREVEGIMSESGCDCFFRQADITQEHDVRGLVEDILARWGKIDILVNNAGISGAGPTFFEITGEDWDRMLTANVRGMFLVTQAVLPHMTKARYGKIVNLSSTGGTASLVACNAHYAASKGAIVAFTKRMARDFAAYGINVNCVAPGLIRDTGFNEQMSQEKLDRYVGQIPLGGPDM